MTIMQQRRGTDAEWTSNSSSGSPIILAEGEIGVEYNTGKAKVGNGSSIWSALPYVGSVDTNTTYSFESGTTNGAFTYTPSDGSATSVPIYGLGSNAYTSTSYAPLAGASFTGTVNVTTDSSQVVLKNTTGSGVRIVGSDGVSGSLPGVIFSPYIGGVEKTNSQFFYSDNGDRWNFETDVRINTGTLITTSTSASVFNTTAITLNVGGDATTLNLGASTGNTQVNNNLVVAGSLTVEGDQIITNTATVEVEDTMIYIGTGNSANAKDIGVVGHFNNGTYQHTGLVRDASDNVWKLFSNVSTEPSNDVLDFTSATYDGLKIGALNATTGTFSGTLDVTGYATLSGTLDVGGVILATQGITGSAAKNMTVASLMPSSGTASSGVGVIMTAAATGYAPPTKRPNGDNLAAGDVWISW